LTEKPAIIGNDVWFVGHCIVSPIIADNKSMAMVGSVITKDMKFNEIYAGSPAKSISDKIGFQFKEVSLQNKLSTMKLYLKEWDKDNKSIKIVSHISEIDFN